MARRRISVAMLSRASWLLIWVFVTASIVILYLLPNAGPPGTFSIDKIAHFVAFGAIGFPAWPGTRHQWLFRLLIITGLCLAVGLEWLQSFVPGRDFTMLDTFANLSGLGGGLVAGLYLEAIVSRHGKSYRPD